jgi:hypothetical protein
MEEVRLLTGIARHTLRDSAEILGWHLSEAKDGSLRVCLDSLLRSI